MAMLGILICMIGCTPSLHPLYTKNDLIFDPQLVGVWGSDAEEGDENTWTFTKSGEKSYSLSMEEAGKKGGFEVHMLKVGDYKFIDYYPEELEEDTPAFYRMHFLRFHTFMRVKISEDTLQLEYLDNDWLEGHLKSNPEAVQHEVFDGDGSDIVLIDKPKNIQAFLKKHLKDKDAWKECKPMVRVTKKKQSKNE